uniref:Uncharacterized protein n=1 Tax=Oryza brachyantha TaxID=4533 RepID=J3MCX8_ORYBR
MAMRSKFVVATMLVLLLLSVSSWWPPAAAARPLQVDEDEAAGVVGVLVLPSSSLWRLRRWLPVLEMKQGSSASCGTWDPNNVNCPPKPPGNDCSPLREVIVLSAWVDVYIVLVYFCCPIKSTQLFLLVCVNSGDRKYNLWGALDYEKDGAHRSVYSDSDPLHMEADERSFIFAFQFSPNEDCLGWSLSSSGTFLSLALSNLSGDEVGSTSSLRELASSQMAWLPSVASCLYAISQLSWSYANDFLMSECLGEENVEGVVVIDEHQLQSNTLDHEIQDKRVLSQVRHSVKLIRVIQVCLQQQAYWTCAKPQQVVVLCQVRVIVMTESPTPAQAEPNPVQPKNSTAPNSNRTDLADVVYIFQPPA